MKKNSNGAKIKDLFGKNWTCAEAIQALFFADENDDIGKNDARIIEINKLTFGKFPREKIILDEQQKETVEKAFLEIRNAMKNLKAVDKLNPILWTRWALRSSGIPVTNEFTLKLALWRTNLTPPYIVLYQRYDPENKTWRGKNILPTGVEKQFGYTLEQILTQKKFSFNEYEVKWKRKIKKLRFIVEGKKNRPPRPIEEVCGKNVLATLSECIRIEAESGKSEVLSAEQKGGKYECSITPAEMIAHLRVKHPEAMDGYKDSTLKRGLSSMVRCPRGRPGGIRR